MLQCWTLIVLIDLRNGKGSFYINIHIPKRSVQAWKVEVGVLFCFHAATEHMFTIVHTTCVKATKCCSQTHCGGPSWKQSTINTWIKAPHQGWHCSPYSQPVLWQRAPFLREMSRATTTRPCAVKTRVPKSSSLLDLFASRDPAHSL